ncbi:hypothetical protein DDY07_04300 [Methylomonas sp. ZR1]|nr:hypothetical protein [Methylomonas sp. ZR1]
MARLGRLARKVKMIATIAKYLVHELKRVARKAFRFNRQGWQLVCKVKKFATIAKDRVRELKCFERSVIRHVG